MRKQHQKLNCIIIKLLSQVDFLQLSKKSVGLLISIFSSIITLAQQNTSLKGIVKNSADKQVLIGAILRLDHEKIYASTDVNGSFELKNVPQQTVTLICEMYGFETETLKINPPFNSFIEITLQPKSVGLKEIEIVGIAEGNLKAMLDMKEAENIKNVVSAEQIKTFPDVNAAEVMQRMSGIALQRDQGDGRFVQLRGTPPEFTTFNINGEQIPSPEGGVRYVGMDIIPSDQIEFIEVNKVLTPDMDADGIAGAVNIKTKMATKQEGEISVTITGGYGNIRARENYQGQFSYGQRKGKLGFQLNSSYFHNVQGSDNLEFKFVKGTFFGSQDAGENNYFLQYREVQLRHYDIQRTRIAISPTLDYKFSDKSRVYIKAMHNDFNDFEVRRRRIYDVDDALSDSYYLYGGIQHDVKARNKIQKLSSVSVGGEHEIFKVKLDYQLFYAVATEEEPDRIESVFENTGNAIAIQFDKSNPNFPRASFPSILNSSNANNYATYFMDELLFRSGKVNDVNLTPRVNMEIPFTYKEVKGYFKVGGKIRHKEKSRDNFAQNFGSYRTTSNLYPGTGPELNLLTITDNFEDNNLLNRGYVMNNMPSYENLALFYEQNPQFFILDRLATTQQNFGEDYKARENISSAYAMFRVDIKKLMVIGGLRWEETKVNYTGNRILTNGRRVDGIDTLTDTRFHTFLLPQIQLKYAFNKSINIRAAYTETYSRPNFDYVLPYRQQSEREEIRYGNPNLKYPKAYNYDFMVEKYLKKGILTGGIFYKKIDDFIVQYKRFAHEGDPQNFSLMEITTPINGLNANVYGAELQAQFMLNFLPGFWKKFGWFSNYTFTNSSALISERLPANVTDAIAEFGDNDFSNINPNGKTEKITLPGQAKHTANFAVFYDGKKMFIRVTANYQDAFLTELGADKDLDVYYDYSLRYDITASYRLNTKVQFFANALNLTNTPLRKYLGNPDVVQMQEFYSWGIRAGIRINY